MKFEEKTIETKTADTSVVSVTTSEFLFSGARELVIKHVDEDYRLRLTNQGKLILTK
ncbi:MAG: hemin uptake protein HemP [Methylotenera sp.]|nr:hemin uptake protein HemP [Methylotenera sp.]MDO9389443.1 hemin uptake protein HemP [Methylotenera sp.]MDP2102950.1 hemin uptake protein HemP [Methylotenera sp.]MDP2280390.1 hemin uptake protein HemP [Methylotenera sp.]MDP3059848.1 hemin uptake protein HemP [Methylotenera sp.]